MEKTSDKTKTAVQGEMLHNRVKKRYQHLKKWARRIGIDVFRLYDRDIPEIPLVLDLYGDTVSGALYKRPYEKDPAEETLWLTVMAGAVSDALGIKRDRIFLKHRERQRGKSQYHKLGQKNVQREIHEEGLSFRVNLSDYLDTGFFPDRRRMRSRIRSEASGKTLLNLFCYTATFSVCAAVGGAEEIDSVDLSHPYLRWAAVNFGLNHLKTLTVSPEFLTQKPSSQGERTPYRLIQADVLPFLDAALKARLSWDIIILDPPAFSNSKKMSATLDIKRDHKPLISRCLSLLKDGGKLWFSGNARHFRLDPGEFPRWEVTDLTPFMEDEDFRGKKLPFCYTFTQINPLGVCSTK
ncbi:MAG: class I SAM-dependent methyltransferase [Spirochaetaceae bacterium]|jgi:23S rRNA G2069 N7-methylase RlmK/C1962 C5-methylase RlmI|nr:class I SAM-dependent methyltransferase [Spirochaetaceae bacterium]